MTRRRIVFTDSIGKRFVTPEFNGDKAEFELFGMGDACTANWDEIMALFQTCSTLEEFKATNDQAQRHYRSSIAPEAPPEPVVEIDAGKLLPGSIARCELVFLAERGAG